MRRSLSFHKRWRRADEERAPIFPAQHAGERTRFSGLDFFKNRATFLHAKHPVVYRVGHPHRSLRIQADSVRRNLDLRQNLANVG